jgi:regulator of sigma E protease
MEILVKAAQFLLSISILVLLHELGHFLFAKGFKTRVEKFYLFFDPWFSLFKIKRGETEYGVGWLPLGGYVKISGMIDESMDREQMKKPPEPHEFRSKPAWQRLLIMVGGVLVNFILALVIYAMVLFVWGTQYLPPENMEYGIGVDSLGQQMGLKGGDKIISVDGKEFDSYNEIIPYIVLNEAETIQLERDGKLKEITIPDSIIPALIKNPVVFTPRIPFIVNRFTDESAAKEAGIQKEDRIVAVNGKPVRYFDAFRDYIQKYKEEEVVISVVRNGDTIAFPVTIPTSGLIGVYPVGELDRFFEIKQVNYGFWEAIPAGITLGVETMSDYLKQFKLLFTPKTKAYESLGGFMTIGNIFPGQWNWEAFWTMTAFLSIILAIMNILPIPALDGGHVMFLLYELVSGRKPGEKFLEYAQITGMIILFSLLIYANGNDIIRYFF